MGIFGDLDLDTVASDPFKVEDGTYEADVTGATVGETAKGDKIGLTIKYTITDGDSPMFGRSITEWQHIPQPSGEPTPQELRSASFLKSRLISLGVPENEMNSMQPEDLLGISVVVTVREKDGYTNITRLILADQDPTDFDI